MGRPPPGGLAGAVEDPTPGGTSRTRQTTQAYARGANQPFPRPDRPNQRAPGFFRPAGAGRASPILASVPGRTAAFFDLDKTVIATSSALAFGRRFYASGLINRRAMLKSAYAQFVYMLAGADESQMGRLRDEMAAAVTGWDAAAVRGIVDEALHDLIDPLVYDEAAGLIESHRSAGHDVVVVSSSGEDIVRPIAAMLGADDVIATRVQVVDGRYTGEIEFYAAGPAKATAIREMAARVGYDLADCYAYSDSATDVPMLEVVGHPAAVNPDRALRRTAQERGWPILRFQHPVPMRSRFDRLPSPSRPALVGMSGVLLLVLAAGVQRKRTQRKTGLGKSRSRA